MLSHKIQDMNKLNRVIVYSILIMSIIIAFSGCKKKTDESPAPTYPADPIPAFTITYQTVPLASNDTGVKFFANCSTTGIKMTKVDIVNPINVTITFALNGQIFDSAQVFALQSEATIYQKHVGTYRIIFSGFRKVDNAPFTIVTYINVTRDDPYPAVSFIVTYLTVQLQVGGEGVQFYANCNSTDVKMTKVEILDPIHSGTVTYNLNGNAYVRSQIFALQDNSTAYAKQSGTYQITFSGLRTADSAPFVNVVNVPVSK